MRAWGSRSRRIQRRPSARLALTVLATLVVGALAAGTVGQAGAAAEPRPGAATPGAAAPGLPRAGTGRPATAPVTSTATSTGISTAIPTATRCPAPALRALSQAPRAAGASRSTRTVALTFDDGPGPVTEDVLAILRAEHVRATFFLIGSAVDAHPQLARRIVAEGHLVGDHSYTHASFARLSPGGQRAELRRADRAIAAATGVRPCWFRPPYGALGASTVTLARARGESTVIWTVDTLDWTASTRLRAADQRAIAARARAGTALTHPVVLMHDGGPARPNMLHELPGIIAWYRAHGYTFVGLDGRPAA